MRIKAKSRKGVTLVELMTAIFTGLIVLLAAGSIMVLGQKSWNDAWKRASLQRDASYVMFVMSRSIREATDANSPDGKILYIPNQSDPDRVKFSYIAGAKDLQYQLYENGSLSQTQTIIDGKVENLQFGVNDGNGDGVNDTVTIDVELEDGNVQTHFLSAVMMRNAGG